MSTTEPNVSETCARRVKRDIREIMKHPPSGIFCIPDDKTYMQVHCIIIGPDNTPYEKGFFYFLVTFTPDYPMKPPNVKFMTTGGGQVRFNPNLYKDGKVCLSILGTWSGPEWSPGFSLTSVLLSIQSLLSETPYYNEPGYDKERMPGDSKHYNDMIRHETYRVAVCGMVSNSTGLAIPEVLLKYMRKRFLLYFDTYEHIILQHYDMTGQKFCNPFDNVDKGVFTYDKVLEELHRIKEELLKNNS